MTVRRPGPGQGDLFRLPPASVARKALRERVGALRGPDCTQTCVSDPADDPIDLCEPSEPATL